MKARSVVRPIVLAVLVGILAWELAAAEDEPGSTMVTINPLDIKASNIADASRKAAGQWFAFKTSAPSPVGAEFFFVRYSFRIPREGLHRLPIQTVMRLRGCSGYSYVIDGGPVRQLVHKRIVGRSHSSREGHGPELLSAGEHTLELRFLPDQRVRIMNRVTEDYEGHSVQISAIRFVPEPQAEPAGKGEPLSNSMTLRRGDQIAFLGDSITDEEHFPGHFARILDASFPQSGIVCYNSGIGLNRASDGLARLDRNIMRLAPQWVIVNYGVNDAMQVTPDQFAESFESIVRRLREQKIGVVCVAPTGFHAERFPDGKYFYTRDQASALDRTAQHEAAAIKTIAQKHGCLFVDALGVLSHCDVPRDRLMGNQWHPNSEGGRIVALAILRSLGFTQADAERTGDQVDSEYFKMLRYVPEANHPEYRSESRVAAKAEEKMIAVASYTRNMVFFFSPDGRKIAQVPVAHHPLGLAYRPRQNDLWVVCEGAARVERIDVRTFTRKGSIELDDDDYPSGIRLAAGGRTAWIGIRRGPAEIDLENRRVLRVIALDAFLQSVTLVETQNTILAGTPKGVAIIDIKSGLPKRWLPIDNAWGSMQLSDDTIGIIDTGHWRTHVISVPSFQQKRVDLPPIPSRAIVRDADCLWAGDWQNHALIRIDQPSGRVRRVASVEFPLSIALIDRSEK